MEKERYQAEEYIKKKAQTVNPHFRNAFHLSAPVGWINDPNGFVYYKGEYHLFYQYHPYSTQWGPMHWGHAKSKDLLVWEHLPVALAPSEAYDKDGCFSGSALVVGEELVLMYTGHVDNQGKVSQTQCMARSSDGIHFEKSPANPVIGQKEIEGIADSADFRDPKMLYHDGRYYCVVASKTKDQRGQILLFSSSDVTEWQFVSVLLEGTKEQGIMWECPDLFALDGKWVLLLSPIEMKRQGHAYHNLNSTLAFIGEMDWPSGRLIVEKVHEVDGGMDFYAPQTCQGEDGSRVMVAWMQMWHRTIPTDQLGHGWAGSMTLPRRLRLNENRLYQELPPSLEEAKRDQLEWSGKVEGSVTLKGCVAAQQVVDMRISHLESWTMLYPKSSRKEEGISLSYDAQQSLLTLSRAHYGHPITGQEAPPVYQRTIELAPQDLSLCIVRDTSSLEVFVQGKSMSLTFYETEAGEDLQLLSEGAVIQQLTLSRLTVGQGREFNERKSKKPRD